MGSTLSWKSSVSWLREIFSFWNWTTGSRASSRMNIYSLGMNHLISHDWNAVESQKLRRFVTFNEPYYCRRFHVIRRFPPGDTVKSVMFIPRIFGYFWQKWTWIHSFMVWLEQSKCCTIDRFLVIFDFCEMLDAVTSSIPEIWGGSFLMNKYSFD